jgi:hypothetical protein
MAPPPAIWGGAPFLQTGNFPHFFLDVLRRFFPEPLRVEDFFLVREVEDDFFARDVDFFVLLLLRDFLPPPSCLFTVRQARSSASPLPTPRFS